MAILQTAFSERRASPPQPFSHGVVHAVQATADFTSVTGAVGDIVDMVQLPAGAVIVDAYLCSDAALATTTWDVGFMSGEFGSKDGARTSGAELFSGASLATGNATIVRVTKPDALSSAPSASDRSIGLKIVTANVTAGANKRVNLTIFYRQ